MQNSSWAGVPVPFAKDNSTITALLPPGAFGVFGTVAAGKLWCFGGAGNVREPEVGRWGGVFVD